MLVSVTSLRVTTLTGTSVNYDGPALTPGAEYYYWVVVDDAYGNSSFAEERFVYQIPMAGSISRTVKGYLLNPVKAGVSVAMDSWTNYVGIKR